MATKSVDDIWNKLKAQGALNSCTKQAPSAKAATPADEQFNKLWLSLNGVGKRPGDRGPKAVELEADQPFKAPVRHAAWVGAGLAENSGAAGFKREGAQSSDASKAGDKQQLTTEGAEHIIVRNIAALKDPSVGSRRKALQDIQVSPHAPSGSQGMRYASVVPSIRCPMCYDGRFERQ